MSLGTYDAWRQAHPEASLHRAKFLHPLRINMGFVGLQDEPALAAASRVIARSRESGELARWAEAAGVTWIAPQPPDLNPSFGLFSLRLD